MRLSISGLGDAAACGTSPCTWWDDIYVRDACVNYLACANPNDVRYIGATQGAGAAIGASFGQTVGGAVSGAGQGLWAALTGGQPSQAGGTMVIIAGVALAGLLVLGFVLSKR